MKLTQVNRECTPLHRRGMKISIVHVKISCANRLRSKSIEQGNFGSTSDTHYKIKNTLVLMNITYFIINVLFKISFIANNHSTFIMITNCEYSIK